MYWLTKWYEILRLLVKLHDIVCADFGNFLIHRMVQRSSTIRKKQLPCLDLDTSYFSTCRMLWARLPRIMLQFMWFRSSYLTCIIYTQQQIEASLQLWNIYYMWVYHCLGWLKCTSPNTRKTSARDQRISENSFFAYKKNDFLLTPPGVGGGVSKILGLKA